MATPPFGETRLASSAPCAQHQASSRSGALGTASGTSASGVTLLAQQGLFMRSMVLLTLNTFRSSALDSLHWAGSVWWAGLEPSGLLCNTFCLDGECQEKGPCLSDKPAFLWSDMMQDALRCDQSSNHVFLPAVHGSVTSSPLSSGVVAHQEQGSALQAFVAIDQVFVVALDAYGKAAPVPGAGACDTMQLTMHLGFSANNVTSTASSVFSLHRQNATVQLQNGPVVSQAWEAASDITPGASIFPPALVVPASGGMWAMITENTVAASAVSGALLALHPVQPPSGDQTALLPTPRGQHNMVVQKCNRGFQPDETGQCEECEPGTVSPDGSACSPCPPGQYFPARGGAACETCQAPAISNGPGRDECSQCLDGTYVVQDNSSQCQQCPLDELGQGALCVAGRVRLQPGYFFIIDDPGAARRAAGQNGSFEGLVADVSLSELPISTQVVPCINPAACVSTDGLAVTCSPGHQGIMCGDCKDGYLNTGSSFCLQCLPTALNFVVLVMVTVGITAGVVYISMAQSFAERDDASIVLRMLLNHMQMMGLLSLLRAQGTELFREIFNFSNTLNGGGFVSPTSSVRCIWDSDYFIEFAMNMSTTPYLFFVVFLTGLIASLWGTMVSVTTNPKTLKAVTDGKLPRVQRGDASQGRRASKAGRVLSPRSGGTIASPTSPTTPAADDDKQPNICQRWGAAAAAGCTGCLMVCRRTPCNRTMGTMLSRSAGSYTREGGYFSTMAFIANLTFSLVTSTVLNAFRCTTFTAFGHQWLLADLSVPCYSPGHIVTMIIAVVVGAAFSIGFPITVMYILHKNKAALAFDPDFRKRYAFLIAGYKTEHAETEGLTMLRRVALALVSVIGDPLHEINAAALVILGALSIHVSTQPYKRPLFNLLESVSLWSVELTLFLSLAFLEVSRSASSGTVDLQATNFEAIELGITVALCVVNFSAILLMLVVLARFYSAAFTERLVALSNSMPFLKNVMKAVGMEEEPSDDAAQRKAGKRASTAVKLASISAVLALKGKAPKDTRPSTQGGGDVPITKTNPVISGTANPLAATSKRQAAADSARSVLRRLSMSPREGAKGAVPARNRADSSMQMDNPLLGSVPAARLSRADRARAASAKK